VNSSETPQTPAAPANAAPVTDTSASQSTSQTHEPHPAASADAPNAAASADHAEHDAGDDAGGDDGDDASDEKGETQAADGAPGAAPGTPGADGKKKRRRRRRKKHGAVAADGSTAPAEGAAAEGAEAKPGEPAKHDNNKKKDKRKDKPREHHRERPAFSVGDVVFGKILEVGEDAIFVDVAGKAKAVFDKLELLLPEDVADTIDEENRKAEAAAEALLRADKDKGDKKDETAEATPAVEAATETAKAIDASPADAAHAEAESALAAHEAQLAAEEAAAAQEHSESASNEADSQSTEAGGENAEAKPGVIQLPRVVLEAGAPFVGVVHNDGGRGGLVVLTHHPKRGGKAKPAIAGAFKNKTEIFGLVTGVIKGGVEVDIDGLRAFAPGSHMSLHLGADLTPFVGKRLPFFVTQYAKRGRDIVLSRRSKLESEAKAAREAALSRVKQGDKVEGTVRSVVPFGAFVDIGGVEGLVSLSEMSHNRSDTPSDVFKVGQKTEVIVQRIDDRGKIWLSHKATIADPWAEVATKYALGTKHHGKIVRIQPFGAFVELESGVDGLIHVADFFGIKDPVTGQLRLIENPNEVVKVGDEIDVVVSQLDTSNHKIALHPALLGDQANEEPQKVQMGKMLKVVVVGVESGGLLVRILGATGRNARGYITAAATNTPRGTELRKPFPIGTQLEAKVLEVDARKGEAKLSVKALQQDTERNAYQQYRQQVKREAKFGTFGDLLAQNLAKKNPTK
jgi:small subunit ribosomal protein S1